MGLFDGVLGGIVGAEMATVVNSLIEQHGGIGGLVQQLEQQGLGAVARSWVANGPNQAITPAQVSQIFGSGLLGQLARQAGISPQDLATRLSQALPTAIDKLTPAGSLPPAR